MRGEGGGERRREETHGRRGRGRHGEREEKRGDTRRERGKVTHEEELFGEVGGSGTDRLTRRISSLRRRRVWRGVVEGGGGRRGVRGVVWEGGLEGGRGEEWHGKEGGERRGGMGRREVRGGKEGDWRRGKSFFFHRFSTDTFSFDKVVCLKENELMESANAIEQIVGNCLTCNGNVQSFNTRWDETKIAIKKQSE